MVEFLVSHLDPMNENVLLYMLMGFILPVVISLFFLIVIAKRQYVYLTILYIVGYAYFILGPIRDYSFSHPIVKTEQKQYEDTYLNIEAYGCKINVTTDTTQFPYGFGRNPDMQKEDTKIVISDCIN